LSITIIVGKEEVIMDEGKSVTTMMMIASTAFVVGMAYLL
jgi:hypothetical protein